MVVRRINFLIEKVAQMKARTGFKTFFSNFEKFLLLPQLLGGNTVNILITA